jgi:hypothetical protein
MLEEGWRKLPEDINGIHVGLVHTRGSGAYTPFLLFAVLRKLYTIVRVSLFGVCTVTLALLVTAWLMQRDGKAGIHLLNNILRGAPLL